MATNQDVSEGCLTHLWSTCEYDNTPTCDTLVNTGYTLCIVCGAEVIV